MDLIYADENRNDIGILMDYTLDIAFGKDENDFECTVSNSNHVCREGYMLYIEGTEYGGIIDTLKIDIKNQTIKYYGRSWHGVMEKKILQPNDGEDYLVLQGEANEVLSTLLERVGLSTMFRASNDDSGIYVYYTARYQGMYTVIRKMLFASGAKLAVKNVHGIVEISAVPYIDFSQDEEWDSTQMDFQIEKNYHPINHLICLGTGDLKDRSVIHIFADENGGIQPYLKVDVPYSDEDYILDKSMQVIFGEREITEVYDYSNCESTENYLLLTTKPADWDSDFSSYYKMDDENKPEALEGWQDDIYSVQKIKPADWDENYENYYTYSGGKYEKLSDVSEYVYSVLTTKPADWDKTYDSYYRKEGSDYHAVGLDVLDVYTIQYSKPVNWEKNYGDYFYYVSDGVDYEYKKVTGGSMDVYVVQTLEPSDWKDNFSSYYYLNSIYRYTYMFIIIDEITKAPKSVDKRILYHYIPEVDEEFYKVKLLSTELYESNYKEVPSAVAWEAKRYYTKQSKDIAPPWVTGTYYTYSQVESVPAWASGTYYSRAIQTIPTWVSGKYYTLQILNRWPDFLPDTYYERRVDNYAELVKGGLERMEESYNCDKLSISLDPSHNYGVGDIVGAYDEITGIQTWQPITKKIVVVNEKKEEIEYEIGE